MQVYTNILAHVPYYQSNAQHLQSLQTIIINKRHVLISVITSVSVHVHTSFHTNRCVHKVLVCRTAELIFVYDATFSGDCLKANTYFGLRCSVVDV